MVAGNGGSGASALSLAPGHAGNARDFGKRGVRLQLSADFDLVTDLGSRIGSAEWWRGLVTCTILCSAAYALAPALAPIASVTPTLPDAQWQETRAFAIAPLALGGDTGRRMAPTDVVEPLTDTPERPSIDLFATIGRADSMARVLQRAGVSQAEARQVEAQIGQAVPLRSIEAGTTLDITLGRRPDRTVARPLDALAFRAAFDLRLEVNRVDGQLVLNRIPIAVDNTPLRISGRVGSSLYRAARSAGAPPKAIEAFIRAISSQVAIGSISADDRFDIILEHRRAATGETETGKLLYAGINRARGKDLQLMQWEQGGRLQWFEASGVGKTSGMLQRPVPGAVSSNFGMRQHPILGYSRMHKGMDFRGGYGTPILAASDGRIVRAGWAGGYGKQVRIAHAGGIQTSYSHMSRFVVKPGAQVKQGQVIGYIGSTGLSTGPHLHYELYRNGAAINPATVKFTTRAQLSGGELARFRSTLRSLLAVPARAAAPQETRSAETTAKDGTPRA